MDALQTLTYDSKTEIVAAVLGNATSTELIFLGEPGTDSEIVRLKGRGLAFAGCVAFRAGRVVVEPEASGALDALRILARGAGEFCFRLLRELKPEGYSADVLERLYRLPDPRSEF